jgi:hypothetical protein
LAKRSVGSLIGTTLELGQWVWPLDLKYSTKDDRTLSPLHTVPLSPLPLAAVALAVATGADFPDFPAELDD